MAALANALRGSVPVSPLSDLETLGSNAPDPGKIPQYARAGRVVDPELLILYE
jgi:hypothetical protein